MDKAIKSVQLHYNDATACSIIIWYEASNSYYPFINIFHLCMKKVQFETVTRLVQMNCNFTDKWATLFFGKISRETTKMVFNLNEYTVKVIDWHIYCERSVNLRGKQNGTITINFIGQRKKHKIAAKCGKRAYVYW